MTDPTNVTLPPSTATLIVQPAVKPNPLKALVMSRKFWLAVVGAAQTILAHYVSIPVDVTLSINGLLAIVIAAIAYEDSNKS